MTQVSGDYNGWLIVLSYITAVLAAYTALDLSERVVHTEGWKSKGWLLAGSLTMGLGIWSMHFIGMISFQTGAAMTYDFWLVMLSIVVAFSGSLVSFYVINGKDMPGLRLWAASFAMGVAIASMHFIGMESMEHIKIVYQPVLYTASFAIAITASFAALKLSRVFAKRRGSFRTQFIKIASAILMGGAISGMHYTGMAAATLYMQQGISHGHGEMDTVQLGIAIVIFTLLLQALLIFGAFHDKRLLIQAEKIRDNEERFQSLINYNIDPIYVFSFEGRMLFANSSGCRLLKKMGIETPAMLSSVFPHEERERLLGWFHQVKSEKQALNRDTQITLYGKQFDLNLTLIPVYVRQNLDSIYLICKDMTKQREAERKIHRMAHYDALTDLPNRRYACIHLENVLHQHSGSTAVLFLDLNRFKEFNDALGHDIGDLLLIEASKRLAECVPEQGFIARLGGDEFIIIIPADPRKENIDRLAQKLIRQFETAFHIKEHRLKTSVSIGIAISPLDGTDGEELMKKADMAMYAVKEKNKSRYQYFSPSIKKQPDMKESLILMYVPQFSVSTQKVAGAEAVCLNTADAAIRHPEDMTAELGKWMIDEACRQAKKWHDSGTPLTVPVNVPPRHFESDRFIRDFEECLATHRLPPGLIEAEVTESMIMDHLPYSKRKLVSLKMLGVGITIDHFGTGSSSLNVLQDLPVSKIQIDKSFIKGIPSDSKSERMAAAIISFARHLSLETAAEGAKTAEQKEWLLAKGCGVFQQDPCCLLSAEEIEKLLSEHGSIRV
ncbi:diguanylate cyclase [Bacillus glycinifermentans]|uniref:diguanylate cyclase domain-containing protein n=1 Tax=Bacillus glycinifermentans TaxID=1664069 RepID=UPI001C227B95|nr:diguanylate cyclase [Bacillus glycinifermentans]MBU8787197.1 diguanylate cyclase [Bacillus glycinifermentans]